MPSLDVTHRLAETRPARPGHYLWIAALVLMILSGQMLRAQLDWPIRGTPIRLVALLVLAVLLLAPSFRRLIFDLMDAISHPSATQKWLWFVTLTVISGLYSFHLAYNHTAIANLPWIPDENVYLIQARMAAQGRLWMPTPPLPEFFVSPYLFVTPVYAAKYTPGTALLLIPQIWLHLPKFAVPLMEAALCVGTAYLLFTELLDGACGVLAALAVLATPSLHLMSLEVLPYAPALLFIMLTLWAALLWHRKGHTIRWAAAVGFFSSFALIIRPAESLCFILPLGAAMLADLWCTADVRVFIRTAAVILLAATPLLAIQVISNIGITGHWYELPYQKYMADYSPAHRLGFTTYHQRQQSLALPLFEALDRGWEPALMNHTPSAMFHAWNGGDRFKLFCQALICDGWMFLLLPAGLLGLTDRYRWAVFLGLPLFVLLYSLYPFYLYYYSVPALPIVLLLTLLGIRGTARAFPGWRLMQYLPVLLMGIVFVTALPEFDNKNLAIRYSPAEIAQADRVLNTEVRKPAVVLFQGDGAASLQQIAAYNPDVASPQDAPVIRAHDLGLNTIRLFRYFASRQPDRRIYIYHLARQTLEYLGTARELSGSLHRPLRQLDPRPHADYNHRQRSGAADAGEDR